MAREGTGIVLDSGIASGAIVENSFVTLDTAKGGADVRYYKQAGAGDVIYGVSPYSASDGDTVAIAVAGRGVMVKTGATPGAITRGSQLKADASGLAVVTSTALANTGGRSLGATTSAGVNLPIVLEPFGSVKAAS